MSNDASPPPSDAPEPKPEDRVGTILGQRYKLIKHLAEGGLGYVYLAEDLAANNQHVALKLLKREFSSDPEVLARFEREAKTMLALAHEHIVNPLGYGRSPEGDMVLVMEFVEGETLRSVLKRTRPFPAWGVVEIARQLAAALARAHSLGVVHRDLKPENVMVKWRPDGRPHVKVLDFGMARLLVGTGGPQLTRKGAVFGTPEYMPPEQCMGQPVDARADQYALGVMLYEMIAGQRPFKATSPLAMVQMQIRQQPPPLVELAPGTPPAAAAVIARMMAKRPDERFPDVLTAAMALHEALFPGVPPGAPVA